VLIVDGDSVDSPANLITEVRQFKRGRGDRIPAILLASAMPEDCGISLRARGYQLLLAKPLSMAQLAEVMWQLKAETPATFSLSASRT
jgi:hypothetical protein